MICSFRYRICVRTWIITWKAVQQHARFSMTIGIITWKAVQQHARFSMTIGIITWKCVQQRARFSTAIGIPPVGTFLYTINMCVSGHKHT